MRVGNVCLVDRFLKRIPSLRFFFRRVPCLSKQTSLLARILNRFFYVFFAPFFPAGLLIVQLSGGTKWTLWWLKKTFGGLVFSRPLKSNTDIVQAPSCDTFLTPPRAPVPAAIVFFTSYCYLTRARHLVDKVTLQVTTLRIYSLLPINNILLATYRECRNPATVMPKFAWAKQQIAPPEFAVKFVQLACTSSAQTWTTPSSNHCGIPPASAGCVLIAAIQKNESRLPTATPSISSCNVQLQRSS